MGALCVRVKNGEVKLERAINGVAVILVPGYIYPLPIAHPREITGLDGNNSVDSNGENPGGLIWWYDRRKKPIDLEIISRDALMANRMVREQIMARVRTRLDAELGRGYSEKEKARLAHRKLPGGRRIDPDDYLLETFNGMVSEKEQIKDLPPRDIDAPKGCTAKPLETDKDGDKLDLPHTTCRHCGHDFPTQKKRKLHVISVHKARRSRAKQKWRAVMDQSSLVADERPL